VIIYLGVGTPLLASAFQIIPKHDHISSLSFFNSPQRKRAQNIAPFDVSCLKQMILDCAVLNRALFDKAHKGPRQLGWIDAEAGEIALVGLLKIVMQALHLAHLQA
jgi:hypothetical protein